MRDRGATIWIEMAKRSIVGMSRDSGINRPVLRLRAALDERFIGLSDTPLFKLFRERALRVLVASNHHDARCIHIEAMDCKD